MRFEVLGTVRVVDGQVVENRAVRLRGVPGGYQLEVAPDELDALVFAGPT